MPSQSPDPHSHPPQNPGELERLRAVEHTLNMAMEILHDGIWDWDLRTGTVWRSPGCYRMLGCQAFELPPTEMAWVERVHPDDRERVHQLLETYLSGRSTECCTEYRCLMQDGGYLWVEDQAYVVEWDDHRPLRVIGCLTNIHERKLVEQALQRKTLQLERLNQQLEQLVEQRTRELALANQQLTRQLNEITRLSTTDSLTQIFNRRKFEQVFADELLKSRHGQRPLALMMFDIDFFKQINDRYGHQVGDEVLVEVARCVSGHLRQTDTFARWGGEEFVLLLPRTRLLEAHQLAERLRLMLAEHVFPHGVRLTVSFGITGLRPGENMDELVRRADRHLYEAKGERNSSICRP